MPRISAASFRFQRVLVSIRRISSRSASRAAVRAMSFRDTLVVAVAPAGCAAVIIESMPMLEGAGAVAMGATGAAAAGGGTTGCSGGAVGRGVIEGEAVCGQ